jgi:hypothetical protein
VCPPRLTQRLLISIRVWGPLPLKYSATLQARLTASPPELLGAGCGAVNLTGSAG